LSKLRKGSVLAVGALAALSVAVTGAFGGPATQAATTVAVTAGKPSEFKYTLKPKTVKKGVVTFKITNRGALAHDFKIAGKKTKQIPKGKTATLRITFKKAGKFPYLCTLPSHAAAGMKGTLVVK
jgi:uncharacterized cupredoxin-like copper-binding protein